jgi:hypothetical protein
MANTSRSEGSGRSKVSAFVSRTPFGGPQSPCFVFRRCSTLIVGGASDPAPGRSRTKTIWAGEGPVDPGGCTRPSRSNRSRHAGRGGVGDHRRSGEGVPRPLRSARSTRARPASSISSQPRSSSSKSSSSRPSSSSSSASAWPGGNAPSRRPGAALSFDGRARPWGGRSSPFCSAVSTAAQMCLQGSEAK